ncbi:phage antirepressor N-terminal domain-containing protein [Micromonospora sp. RTGN7]|uniref:phage antirepressor N-terminal domain-containing protein n=1 Tax=Micromonospora sp. RTGN7 TaxID=3016526 RepID=UPI0029FF49C5|nr:phage antirepressor N-terminal domain-containing protein [Micromonospora sp. RTGN7]
MTDIVRIPFHGTDLLAVEIDGRPHVVLRAAFEAIGLDADRQIAKVKSQPWASTAVTAVQVPGDDQTRNVVTADVRTFLMALATIPASRVAEHARPLLIAYQAEVADVIEAYWTRGGVINPRATGDQLDAIIGHAERQMRVLRLADGLVDRRWLEVKTRHTVARALGEEPEVPTEMRPLTTGEYLEERGVTGSDLRSIGSVFGKRLKAAFVTAHGEDPPAVERFIGGTTRRVAGYTEADRPLFDQVWEAWYAADYDPPMALMSA